MGNVCIEQALHRLKKVNTTTLTTELSEYRYYLLLCCFGSSRRRELRKLNGMLKPSTLN